jgi:hypothetical protein
MSIIVDVSVKTPTSVDNFLFSRFRIIGRAPVSEGDRAVHCHNLAQGDEELQQQTVVETQAVLFPISEALVFKLMCTDLLWYVCSH